MFNRDVLSFQVKLDDVVAWKDLEKYNLEVIPYINNVKPNMVGTVVNLQELAIMYQRTKFGISGDSKPYSCSCGDSACIGVFTTLKQNVGLLTVEWLTPKNEAEKEDYEFLGKMKIIFGKKQFLKSINDLFLEIENLINSNPNHLYEVTGLYTLSNALKIWKGEPPDYSDEGLKSPYLEEKEVLESQDWTSAPVESITSIIEKTLKKKNNNTVNKDGNS